MENIGRILESRKSRFAVVKILELWAVLFWDIRTGIVGCWPIHEKQGVKLSYLHL